MHLTNAKPKYVYLADLFQQLGQQRFGSVWVGTEITAPEVISYAEVQATQERLNAQAAKLNLQSDRQYIAQAVYENEHTGHLDENDYPARTELIFKLDELYSYLDEHRPDNDRSAYEDSHRAYQRKEAVLCSIGEILQQECIQAYEAAIDGRQSVPPAIWGAEDVRLDVTDSSARVGFRKLKQLHFNAAEVFKILATKVPKTAVAKAQAKSRLIAMMQESHGKRRTRDDVCTELMEKISGLTERAFNRAWAEACDQTRSGWNAAGRPRKAEELSGSK